MTLLPNIYITSNLYRASLPEITVEMLIIEPDLPYGYTYSRLDAFARSGSTNASYTAIALLFFYTAKAKFKYTGTPNIPMAQQTKQEELKKYYSSLYEESSGITLIQLYEDIRTNIDKCGAGKNFSCTNALCGESGFNHKRIVREYCGHRICSNPGCIKKRDNILKRKLEPKLNNFSDPRFLTLTLKGHHTLKKEHHQRLNYAWKRLSKLLRDSGFLRRYIKVTELGSQHEGIDSKGVFHNCYNWHLHIVYDGTFISADVLRSAWKRYTKDSTWVHISRVKKNISASAYLRKYLGKLVHEDIDLDEYFDVYKTKFLSTWNCNKERETILELEIEAIHLRCPNCNSRLMPERTDKNLKPPDEFKHGNYKFPKDCGIPNQ